MHSVVNSCGLITLFHKQLDLVGSDIVPWSIESSKMIHRCSFHFYRFQMNPCRGPTFIGHKMKIIIKLEDVRDRYQITEILQKAIISSKKI